MCSNASTFGVQVCIEKKSVHAAFIKNVPLYYLIGEHALRVSFKPGKFNCAKKKKKESDGWVDELLLMCMHIYFYTYIYVFCTLSATKTTIRTFSLPIYNFVTKLLCSVNTPLPSLPEQPFPALPESGYAAQCLSAWSASHRADLYLQSVSDES